MGDFILYRSADKGVGSMIRRDGRYVGCRIVDYGEGGEFGWVRLWGGVDEGTSVVSIVMNITRVRIEGREPWTNPVNNSTPFSYHSIIPNLLFESSI